MSYNLNGTEYDENSYNAPEDEELSSSAGSDPKPEETASTNSYSGNYDQSSYNDAANNSYNSSYNNYNNGAYNSGNNYNDSYNNGSSFNNGSNFNNDYNNYNGSSYNNSNYNGSSYNGGSYGSPFEVKTTNGFGIAGFIIALIGMLLACCFPVFGLITGVLSLIFCIIGVNKKYNVRGLAIAGIVLAVFSFLFSGLGFLLESDSFSDALDEALEELEEEEEYLNDYYDEDLDVDDLTDDYDYFYNDYDDYASFVENYDTYTLDDAVIFDQDDVTITANEIIYYTYDGDIYPYIGLTVDNRSDLDINVAVDRAAVNGISMDYYVSDTVDAGETTQVVLKTYTYDFTYVGYTEVGSLQLQLSIYDDETYNDISAGDLYEVYLTEGFTDFSIDQLNADTVPLKSNNGVTLYYVETTDIEGDGHVDFMFYVENNSDEPVLADFDNLFVNESEQEDYYFCSVYPHSGYFVNLYCDDSSIKESNITSASVEVNVYSSDTYEDFIELETINFITQQ